MFAFMKSISTTALALLYSLVSFSQTPAQVEKARTIVAKMTLEEKARFVVGMGMKITGMPAQGGPTVGITEDKVAGVAGTSYENVKLKIPTAVYADGPAGLRISPIRSNDTTRRYYCTAFPVGTLIASSWDTTLAKNIGQAMGAEAKAYGIDFILAPALNIHRNPLGGRNFEYYSEDPVLSGYMAAAAVNGMESKGVGASIKHFAANNQETNRNQINTIVSERALREIYLRGFEIAVKKSQPWTIMSSYNRINGIYTSESYDLLTTILRKEWGFKGYVMTDWFGGSNPAAQMKAGNDLLMPGTPDLVKKIIEAVKSGLLEEKIVTENAIRMLAVNMQGPNYLKMVPTNKPDLKAHALVARKAAAEGIVLLKNNNVLPLSANVKTIAAFGNTSYDFISGGTGSGDVNEAYTVSLVQGMQQAGYNFLEPLGQQYRAHIKAEDAKRPPKKIFFELQAPLTEYKPSREDFLNAANNADVALITIGRNSGEFQDRKKENDFDLTTEEKQLITDVSTYFKAKMKKVIVVLNIGGVIETVSWNQRPDAIVLAWQGGQEAGNALADILTGKVNPSGKLTMTFPVTYDDVPSSKNFPGKELSDKDVKGPFGMSMGKPSEVVYEEGIYVGYRYYDVYKIKVAYPFGFGLSYTTFDYGKLKIEKQDDKGHLTVSLEIMNIGRLAGREVVQLYVAAPAKNLDKPSDELRAFAKTKLLKPGESQILRFELAPKDLASFYTDRSAWIADAGLYTISANASAIDFKQLKTFTLTDEVVVEKCNKVLVPQVEINEWKGKNK
jgi:beta-glucosidase